MFFVMSQRAISLFTRSPKLILNLQEYKRIRQEPYRPGPNYQLPVACLLAGFMTRRHRKVSVSPGFQAVAGRLS